MTTPGLSLAQLALSKLVNLPQYSDTLTITDSFRTLRGSLSVSRYLARSSGLDGEDAFERGECDYWVDMILTLRAGVDAEALELALKERIYLSGTKLGLADVLVWAHVDWNVAAVGGAATKRWMRTVDVHPALVEARKEFAGAAAKKKKQERTAGGCPVLEGNPEPKDVVTRFPPEPSGHLHVGHCKALFLNQYYAKDYRGGGGKLLLRFDDTNPAAEKQEYEDAILADLTALNVIPDKISHTSDYFDLIEVKALEMIKKGLAFCDFSSQDELAAQRGGKTGIRTPSPCREQTIEENLKLFALMKQGLSYEDPVTKEKRSVTLRAKITDLNGTPGFACGNGSMRDPVLVRVVLDPPHARHGTKYKMFSTYDFACPIVDSVEGVTHVLRDSQYSDRTEQYEWFQNALGLRKCAIQQFSRVNFKRTLMSKRRLAALIDEGYAEGWDDPRFPTIKGMLRRGMLVETIKSFMLELGGSLRNVDMEWDKIWSNNMRALDEIAPRYMAVNEGSAKLVLTNFSEYHAGAAPGDVVVVSVPLFPKDASKGMKSVVVSPEILIEDVDLQILKVGLEFGLMRYCVIKIDEVDLVNRAAKATIVDNGDFKKCEALFTWVSNSPLEPHCVIWEHDFILKEGQEEDEVDDGGSSWRKKISAVSKASSIVVANSAVKLLQKGDVIQFERRGFFKCDKAFQGPNSQMEFIKIPDGKTKAMSVIEGKLEHR